MDKKELVEVLKKHELFLVDPGSGECANLRGADLRDANLGGANLEGASLWNTLGDGKEVVSIVAHPYLITYTKDVLQIGCKQYPFDKWFEFTDDELFEMDGKTGFDFWTKWKPIFELIKP